MKPERFAALKGPDGKPVVTIMGDPDVSKVSLVPRGANGRTFSVAKAEIPAGTEPPDPGNGGSLGATAAEIGAFRRFLSFFTGGSVADTTGKSEGEEPAKSFAEALAPQVFWNKWWDVSSALRESVESVMEDPMLTDKPAEIRRRFADAANYLVAQLPVSNALGLEMVAKAHRDHDDPARELVAKAGKVLSTKNRNAVTSAIAALQAVLDAADTSTTVAKTDNPQEVPMGLNLAAINAATVAAVTAYKAANPQATDAQIQQVAAKSAAEIVAKASIEPAQPGRPTNTLAEELAQSNGGFVNAGAQLQAMIDGAMAGINATVAKMAERLDAIDLTINGARIAADGTVAKSDGATAKAVPGLFGGLEGVAKSLEGISARLGKIENTVPAGNAGRRESNRETAEKADNEIDAAFRALILGKGA